MTAKRKKKQPLGAYAGLDLSLAGTGGVLLNASGDLISTLCFTSSEREAMRAKMPHVVRLSPKVPQGDTRAMWARTVLVALAVKQWLDAYAEPSCLVGIEDHAFGARGTSIYQLGHLHGLVRRDLQDTRKSWLLIAPTELKAAVTGKGNADKKVMMSVATPGLDQEAFGSSTRNNVVDAYWLAKVMLAWSDAQCDEWDAIPESVTKVLRPHAKRQGLMARELLP